MHAEMTKRITTVESVIALPIERFMVYHLCQAILATYIFKVIGSLNVKGHLL